MAFFSKATRELETCPVIPLNGDINYAAMLLRFSMTEPSRFFPNEKEVKK